MNCDRIEPRLDAYMDGDLTEDRSREIERHVAACARCTATLERRRALARAAADLGRDVTPARDLWPGIRDEIAGRISEAATEPRLRPAWARWGALAASLLLVSAAAITALRMRDEPDNPGNPVSGAVPAALTTTDVFEAAGQDYLAATELLLETIEERRGQLPPESVEALDRNLEVIDRALGEIRRTLDDAPAGPERDRAMAAAYAMHKRKFEFLWRVSRLSS